jgi:hypothetical protein
MQNLNGLFYLNNTGHRYVIYKDGKKQAHEFLTNTGKIVVRTAIFYESFGNFAVAQISWKGKKIKVFLGEVLNDQK